MCNSARNGIICLVFSIYYSTQDAIKEMIAANERRMALGDGNGAALATATLSLQQQQTGNNSIPSYYSV